MNSINGISFGAHLSLQNNSLYKHVDRDTANKFARTTNKIPGIMTIRKIGNGQLIAELDKNQYSAMTFDAKDFYARNNDRKANLLKKLAQYMNAMNEFRIRDYFGWEEASDKMIKRQIKRLDKIVGKEKAFAHEHELIKESLRQRLEKEKLS